MTVEQDRSDIDALYSAFDNRNGAFPTADRLGGMFSVGARISRSSANGFDVWSVDQFIAPRIALLTSGELADFHEWETVAHTDVAERAASRNSGYKKSGLRNGMRVDGSGRKFIHLIKTDGRWLIASIMWEDVE